MKANICDRCGRIVPDGTESMIPLKIGMACYEVCKECGEDAKMFMKVKHEVDNAKRTTKKQKLDNDK